MSFQELWYRIVRRASLASMWIRMRTGYGLPFKKSSDPENYVFCCSEKSCLPYLSWSYERLGSDEQTYIVSSAAISALTEHDNYWHKEPDTGLFWPVDFFARIPFQPGNPIGDIQLVWQRSRLQNLITFGLISNLTDACTKHQIIQHMEKIMLSWIKENPWLLGVNYISTMECALRLLSICHAFDMLRNHKVSRSAWQGLMYLVHSHAYFIRRRLCLYSYAGNHTIGECAGLIYASVLFPELPEAEEWLQTGLRHMEREADVQILADGGNREQSFRYLAMIVDLCGLVTMLLKHSGKPIPSSIEQAWNRGRTFLQTFAASPDDLPAIGDSDDGYALSPYLRLSWQNNVAALVSSVERLQVFETSGYSRISGESPHGNMRFSHGKLGTACGFGHGHADALSICWDLDGEPLFVDPGTYLYDREPHFRHYFRGTTAHNTVVVDGFDQALQNSETTFGWTHPYTAKLVWHDEDFDGRTVLLANHDGYSGIGVLHWRALVYDHKFGWIVWDRFDGSGEHTLAMHWHVDAPIEMSDHGFLINRPLKNVFEAADARQKRAKKRSLCMINEHFEPVFNTAAATQKVFQRPVNHADTQWFMQVTGGKPDIIRGNEGLPLGWISRKYGTREPINTLRVEAKVHLPHEFLTLINLKRMTSVGFTVDNELIDMLRDKCSSLPP